MSRRNLLDPAKKTNTRVLENVNEISDIIIRKGFTEFFTDELECLSDRIGLFSNLDTIICELGAGMHNLLYCKNGTEVIVMYQTNNISWLQEYYPLFRKKNMSVKVITGNTTSNRHNGNWLNTPWYLNPDELNKI